MSNQIMKLKNPGDIGNDFRDLINVHNAKRVRDSQIQVPNMILIN